MITDKVARFCFILKNEFNLSITDAKIIDVVIKGLKIAGLQFLEYIPPKGKLNERTSEESAALRSDQLSREDCRQ